MNGKNNNDKATGTPEPSTPGALSGTGYGAETRSDAVGLDTSRTSAPGVTGTGSQSAIGSTSDLGSKTRRASSPSTVTGTGSSSGTSAGRGRSTSGDSYTASSGGTSGASYGTTAGSSSARATYGTAGTTGDRWGSDGSTGSSGYGTTYGEGNQGENQGWSRTSGMLDNLAQRVDLKGNMERHPVAMVGAAFALGYVLGGGRFGTLLLGAGARAFVMPMVRNQLTRLAEGAYHGFNAQQEARKSVASGQGQVYGSNKQSY
jgi:hypothetical protein